MATVMASNSSNGIAASAVPLFATPRTPSRLSIGHEVDAVADSLGLPFLPWQSLVSEVAGEIREDGQGFAYPVVVVLVPRRAGKSVMALATSIHRAQALERGFCWYTAETASGARQMLLNEWMPLLEMSDAFDGQYKARLSNGSESVIFNNKSRIGIFSPNRNGMHGRSGDLIIVDEAWKFSSLDGEELEAGIRPTQLTRPFRQLWIISAGADPHSGWLLDWRKRGRALNNVTDKGVAYFEWHPALDEFGNIAVPLDDPATWAAVHPAVGHTIDLDTLKADRASMSDSNFYRAILNVADLSPEESAPGLINMDQWQLCGDEHATLGQDPGLHLGYDVSPARNRGSIVLSRKLADGLIVAELVAHEQGTDWMPGRIADLAERFNCKLIADSKGAVTTVTRALNDLGRKPRELSYREAQDAVGELLDDVSNKTLRHRRQPVLDEAAERVVPRVQASGAVLLGRRTSSGDITPIGALAASTFSARHAMTREPEFMFG